MGRLSFPSKDDSTHLLSNPYLQFAEIDHHPLDVYGFCTLTALFREPEFQ